MKSIGGLICRALPVVLLATALHLLPSPVVGQSATKTAEQHWSDVVGLASPVGVSKTNNGKRKSQTEITAEITDRAARSRQAAASAKDFYSRFPDHPKANEARKIEALSSLRGVETSDAAQCQAALALAKVFRDAKSYSVDDRFEVALAMEQLSLSLKIKHGQAVDQPATWRRLADSLKREFGDVRGLQSYYMEIARAADGATAAEIAGQVRQSGAASADAKTRAQVILDRAALIGKKLQTKLTLIDGGELDLAQPRQKAFLVIAWQPSDPESLLTLRQYQKELQNMEIIYLAIGNSSEKVRDAREFVSFPGPYCHAATGEKSRTAIIALKLQFSPLPRVYVFERSGTLVGSGKIKEIPVLIGQLRG